MKIPGTVPRIACIVAFVIAGAAVATALSGQIILLPFALIPLAAGIGMLRKSVWSAYGFAVYSFSQVALVPVVLVRSRASSSTDELIGSALFGLVLGCLFVLAGKSLASTCAVRHSSACPWVAVSLLTTVPVVFFQPFMIPTGAMEDTLLVGDRILVQRLPRRNVGRGDMVVFTYPVDRRQTFVKRVIGVPGDRIRISRKVVHRNGVALTEPYALHKTSYEDPYRDDFPSGAAESFLCGPRKRHAREACRER